VFLVGFFMNAERPRKTDGKSADPGQSAQETNEPPWYLKPSSEGVTLIAFYDPKKGNFVMVSEVDLETGDTIRSAKIPRAEFFGKDLD
jgi:hypothetical protein